MERKRLLRDKGIYTKEQLDLLEDIKNARVNLEVATEYFQIVNEPKLIDYAIYMEEAARIKYMYLLNLAKERGIKVNSNYIITNVKAV